MIMLLIMKFFIPKTTTILPVDTYIKEREEANRGKKKIAAGSVVTAKFGGVKEKRKLKRSRIPRKNMI